MYDLAFCVFQLFDHIAECIAKFMEEHQLDKSQHLPLGFTFSFPCRQEGLNVGVLTEWTKGFKCEGVVGEDVVKLLHEAIDRREVRENVILSVFLGNMSRYR